MTPAARVSRFQRFLNGVEVLGNALPHPARQSVRIFIKALARSRNADTVKNADGLCLRFSGIHVAMIAQGLANLLADGQNRIEARHRFLKDH